MSDNENGTVMLPPAKTQEAFVHIGFAKARLTRGRAFVLAILAGAFVALGASFMLMVRSDVSLSPTISLVLGGLAFCLGLFLVLVAGAELFTGNCLMVIGALDGRYPLVRMLRKWAIVYAGNAVGALLVVVLLLVSGFAEMQGGAVGELACSVAASKASLSPVVAFSRGILCNVLVCLAVWMGSAGKTVCDKLAAAILPVVAFVVLGFEHSVANMFFLPLGLVIEALWGGSSVVVLGVASNLVFVTLGNIVGGVAIAAAYWFVYGREDRN
ncbi:formate/nitrite transporter family protein [Collinsella sp.]|uniref:formate/nitrite transporter family protein n=1 Tax=Collinsella sp. TaxID=1965294 RepID=UPI003FEF43F8